MKINSKKELRAFREVLDQTKGSVWLETADGERINLKSYLSKYVALGALIENRYSDLELFCALAEDEARFMKFFNEYPDTLGE